MGVFEARMSRRGLLRVGMGSAGWPGNAGCGAGGSGARPRSATIAISRDDGGLIGVDGDAAL
jgi:hypothetical protein